MPRYMVSRTLPPLSPEQLTDVGNRVKAACSEIGMEWIRSHLTADGKHSYCIFEAPNADACREHAARAAVPIDDVIPLGVEIGPGSFS